MTDKEIVEIVFVSLIFLFLLIIAIIKKRSIFWFLVGWTWGALFMTIHEHASKYMLMLLKSI